jgi:PKHD-type hydroxylase
VEPCAWYKVDDDAYIDSIVNSITDDWEASRVVYFKDHDSVPHDNSDRTSTQQPLPIKPDGTPLTQLLNIVAQLNRDTWNFDLDGTDDVDDATGLLKYEEGGQFVWHTDVTRIRPTRKLGFTLQLSSPEDYEGGELQFMKEPLQPEFKEKGALIVFPSWVWHQVTPVTKGTRLAVVGWVHGPSFQ